MGGRKVRATGRVLVAFVFVFVVFSASVVDAQPVKAPVAAPAKAPVQPPTLPPMSFVPAPEPAPLWPPCDGVDLIYINTFTGKIYPFLNDTPWLQPYKFIAQVVVTNMGYSTVDNWGIGINFTHGEVHPFSHIPFVCEHSDLWKCCIRQSEVDLKRIH